MTLSNNNSTTEDAVAVEPYLAAIAIVDKAKLKLQASIVVTLKQCIPSWADVNADSVDVEHLGGAMTNLIFA
ncbi:hypothetical protein BBJ29_003236, partial [Phytophthora kernoviae]